MGMATMTPDRWIVRRAHLSVMPSACAPVVIFGALRTCAADRAPARLPYHETSTPQLKCSSNGLEAISLCDFGSFSLFAGNWPHGILGVLQHYLPCVDGSGWRNDVHKRLRCVRTGGRRVFRYILLVLKVVLLCCSATRHWAAG
jgi:hypothetical protein